jgi:hypothetical protein
VIKDIALFTGILTLDRITKVLVPHFMDLYQSIEVIPSFFSLTYVLNTGGAFGILAGWDSPFRRIFFIAASIVALGLLIHLYRLARREPSLQRGRLGHHRGGGITAFPLCHGKGGVFPAGELDIGDWSIGDWRLEHGRLEHWRLEHWRLEHWIIGSLKR